jgi:hypothetical protein
MSDEKRPSDDFSLNQPEYGEISYSLKDGQKIDEGAIHTFTQNPLARINKPAGVFVINKKEDKPNQASSIMQERMKSGKAKVGGSELQPKENVRRQAEEFARFAGAGQIAIKEGLIYFDAQGNPVISVPEKMTTSLREQIVEDVQKNLQKKNKERLSALMPLFDEFATLKAKAEHYNKDKEVQTFIKTIKHTLDTANNNDTEESFNESLEIARDNMTNLSDLLAKKVQEDRGSQETSDTSNENEKLISLQEEEISALKTKIDILNQRIKELEETLRSAIAETTENKATKKEAEPSPAPGPKDETPSSEKSEKPQTPSPETPSPEAPSEEKQVADAMKELSPRYTSFNTRLKETIALGNRIKERSSVSKEEKERIDRHSEELVALDASIAPFFTDNQKVNKADIDDIKEALDEYEKGLSNVTNLFTTIDKNTQPNETSPGISSTAPSKSGVLRAVKRKIRDILSGNEKNPGGTSKTPSQPINNQEDVERAREKQELIEMYQELFDKDKEKFIEKYLHDHTLQKDHHEAIKQVIHNYITTLIAEKNRLKKEIEGLEKNASDNNAIDTLKRKDLEEKISQLIAKIQSLEQSLQEDASPEKPTKNIDGVKPHAPASVPPQQPPTPPVAPPIPSPSPAETPQRAAEPSAQNNEPFISDETLSAPSTQEPQPTRASAPPVTGPEAAQNKFKAVSKLLDTLVTKAKGNWRALMVATSVAAFGAGYYGGHQISDALENGTTIESPKTLGEGVSWKDFLDTEALRNFVEDFLTNKLSFFEMIKKYAPSVQFDQKNPASLSTLTDLSVYDLIFSNSPVMVDEKKRAELSSLIISLDTAMRAVNAHNKALGSLEGEPFSTIVKGETFESYFARVLGVVSKEAIKEEQIKLALKQKTAQKV